MSTRKAAAILKRLIEESESVEASEQLFESFMDEYKLWHKAKNIVDLVVINIEQERRVSLHVASKVDELPEHIQVKYDPELIAGFKANSATKQIDRTLKKVVDDMFK